MKKYAIYLSGILLLLSLQSTAQSQQRNMPHRQRDKNYHQRSSDDCPRIYLGISSGINNPVGLIGVQADIAVVSAFSIDGGVGRSTWGWKYYGEARVYLSPCNRGWAFGAGATYSTGLTNFVTTLPTVVGDQQVTVNLQPKLNAMVSAYRIWTMGHRNNRFYLQLGYSIQTSKTQVDQIAGPDLTDDGRKTVETLAPGGLVFGMGFSFALQHHN